MARRWLGASSHWATQLAGIQMVKAARSKGITIIR
jgi:hypothetical protein